MLSWSWEYRASETQQSPTDILYSTTHLFGGTLPARPSTAAHCGERQALVWGGPCLPVHHGRDRARFSACSHRETLHIPTPNLYGSYEVQRKNISAGPWRPRTVGRCPRGDNGVHHRCRALSKPRWTPFLVMHVTHSKIFVSFSIKNHAARLSSRQSRRQATQGG